jgi:methionyl-tRNA formyltransferase
MRILFWGTPEFAVPSLLALGEEGHDVVAVVTQPDRRAGRGRRIRPSPAKEIAMDQGIPVLTPEWPKGKDFLNEIRALEPELSVVVAYGRILDREVLEVPWRGSMNLHASLLPKLRGAAPINWAIIRGHETTGVCVMRMVEEMDAGPVLLRIEEPIGPNETASELTIRLAELGAAALVEALALLGAGAVEEVEQDHAAATYAPKVDRERARVDWSRPAIEVANHVRGMDAVPGAWTLSGEDPLKLFLPTVAESPDEAEPGTVLETDSERGLRVATAPGSVWFGEVQAPGKRRMEAVAWLQGSRLEVGQLLLR